MAGREGIYSFSPPVEIHISFIYPSLFNLDPLYTPLWENEISIVDKTQKE